MLASHSSRWGQPATSRAVPAARAAPTEAWSTTTTSVSARPWINDAVASVHESSTTTSRVRRSGRAKPKCRRLTSMASRQSRMPSCSLRAGTTMPTFGDHLLRGLDQRRARAAALVSVLADCRAQRAARVLEVRPHEPVELLELTGLADQHVLRHRVGILGLLDRRAVGLDDPGVDQVKSAQVRDGVVATDRVVVPAALAYERARRADRRPAEGRDPFGCRVGHQADRVDLGVEHRVDRDEVRPDDVPVDVLQGQRQIVQRVEPILQKVDDGTGVLGAHARNRVFHRSAARPRRHGLSPLEMVLVEGSDWLTACARYPAQRGFMHGSGRDLDQGVTMSVPAMFGWYVQPNA